MADGPLVVACLAPTDLHPEVDGLTGAVRVDRGRSGLPVQEEAALEYALRAGEAWGAEVLGVAAGPAAIDPVLVEVRALGASVVRVAWDGDHRSGAGPTDAEAADLAGDQQAVAAALVAAIAERGRPVLVVCGDRSARAGTGTVPGLVAAGLGLVQALGLVRVEIGPFPSLRAERRLDGGWRESLSVTAPAVVSVEAAGVRLRRAGLASALSSSGHPVPVSRPDQKGVVTGVHLSPARPYRPRPRVVAAPSGDSRQRLLELTGALSNREPPRVVGPTDPRPAAAELLEYLERQGFPRR